MKQLLLFLLVLVLACNQQVETDKQIRVSGKSVRVPDGMVYLVDARNWRTAIDSAKSVNGSFSFQLPADSGYVPRAVAIHYFTGGDFLHPVRLNYTNPFIEINGQGSTVDNFWLEPGNTNINEKENGRLEIIAGPETNLMMQHVFNDIGWMGDRDTLKRNEKMALLKKEIIKNPSSFFLLESIRRSKETYSKEEAGSLLSLFNPRLLKAPSGKMLQEYLAVLPASGTAYPKLTLQSDKGYPMAMTDTAARVNMLVFWASWCTPCRKEIPLLRKLYQQFSGRGLGMTGISIDLQIENWQQALMIEKMPWRQLIVKKDQIERIENIFRFTSIPFIVFTDQNGKEIGRFADYDESAAGLYEELIKKHL
jgi:thiol-disulfide isomerase/thioredoxin